MELENKLKPKKYEVIKLKFAIIGNKNSGKSTFINTFKDYYSSYQDSIIKDIKGTMVIDKSKVNRVFDIAFTEIEDVDRQIDFLKKCNSIFISSSLDKKENYDSVIKVLRYFVDKKILSDVKIYLLGNIISNKSTYFDDLELINNDYQEVIKDFQNDLKVNEFFYLKFDNKEEIAALIPKVISKLELNGKREIVNQGGSCLFC